MPTAVRTPYKVVTYFLFNFNSSLIIIIVLLNPVNTIVKSVVSLESS